MASSSSVAGAPGTRTFIGLDFSTSGARAISVDETKRIVADVRLPYDGSEDEEW